MEIAKCRWCKQDCFLSQDDTGMYYVRSHCPHTVSGPSCVAKDDAVAMWNEMMYTGIPISAPPPSTGHRDRVDRMVASILTGVYANPKSLCVGFSDIVDRAIAQIDTIDAAIAQREKEKMLKDVELGSKQKIQEAIDNPPYLIDVKRQYAEMYKETSWIEKASEG